MTDSAVGSPYDEHEMRCPRLGGPVTFQYCRVENNPYPCSRALACWSCRFDVESLFRSAFSEEVFEKIFMSVPKPKVVTLMELIEKAKRAASEQPKD